MCSFLAFSTPVSEVLLKAVNSDSAKEASDEEKSARNLKFTVYTSRNHGNNWETSIVEKLLWVNLMGSEQDGKLIPTAIKGLYTSNRTLVLFPMRIETCKDSFLNKDIIPFVKHFIDSYSHKSRNHIEQSHN